MNRLYAVKKVPAVVLLLAFSLWVNAAFGQSIQPDPAGNISAPQSPADTWWDESWPYRLPVTVSGSGVAEVSINFSTVFNDLGLNSGLLDLRSVRVVPYQVARAQERQRFHDEEVWWYFLYGDRPPLPNPTVIDRTGLEARLTPWLAWLERVEGLVYYSTTDWSPNPWTEPWNSGNNGNGDGFLFYPPLDDTIAYDPTDPQSNRLVTSIRWELLREGMEDYEYLWLLNGGDPAVGIPNQADQIAGQFIHSRTLFGRVPTDLYHTRAALAAILANDWATDQLFLPAVMKP